MTAESAHSWVEPAQQRSKDKVARILEAAQARIVETGSANLKMTEVAKTSGVAVGTLYQFFPSSTALVEKLFAVEMAPVDAKLHQALAQAQSLEALLEAVEQLLRDQVAFVQTRPVLFVLWGAGGLHPDIQAADFQNTKQNAEQLAHKLIEVLDTPAQAESLHALSMLVCHLWSGVVRLALLDEARGADSYVTHFSGMLRAYARSLGRSTTEGDHHD